MGQILTCPFHLLIENITMLKGSIWNMGKHLRLPMVTLMMVRTTIMRGQGLTDVATV